MPPATIQKADMDVIWDFQRRTIWIAAIFLGLAWVHSAFAQDEEKSEKPPLWRQQKSALECELERLHQELGLEKKHFKDLRDHATPALLRAAEALAATIPDHDHTDMETRRDHYQALLGREVADAVHQKVESLVDSTAMKKYREDYEQACEWQDQFARKHVIVFLDTYLELTDDQITSIDQKLEANWDPVWNYTCFQMSFHGYRVCRRPIQALEAHETEPNQITKQLTDVQNEIFARLNELGRGYQKLIGCTVEEEAKAIEADLQWFYKRTIESLSRDGELDARQLARMKIGFRGALLKVLKQRKEALEKYKENSNLWYMSAVMESAFQQMRSQPIWRKTVRGLFDGESKAGLIASELERANRSMELGAVFGITYLLRTWRIPHDSVTAFYEHATKKIKKAGENNIYRGTFFVFDTPESKLQELLDEKTFEKIQPRLKTAWKRPADAVFEGKE